jgi:hypothetical protein
MIHCDPVGKPVGFEERVEARGAKWLSEHPNAKRPEPYWNEFRGYLADAFHDLCAYSAMYEPVGTVDHFVSWNEDKTRVYDWSNYRFAAAWINSSKLSLGSGIAFESASFVRSRTASVAAGVPRMFVLAEPPAAAARGPGGHTKGPHLAEGSHLPALVVETYPPGVPPAILTTRGRWSKWRSEDRRGLSIGPTDQSLAERKTSLDHSSSAAPHSRAAKSEAPFKISRGSLTL